MKKGGLSNIVAGSIGTKIILAFVIAIAVPVIVGGIILVNMVSNILLDTDSSNAKDDIAQHAFDINLAVHNLEGDVRFLSELDLLHSLIEVRDKNNEGEDVANEIKQLNSAVEGIFAGMSVSNPLFTSIRYIDEFGMEVVKVTSKNGIVTTASEKELTDVSNGLYIHDVMSIAPGKVYVTNLDLKRGGVDMPVNVPHESNMRYAAPVFNKDGERRGAIIAALSGDAILNTFKLHDVSTDGLIYLVDANGFYIYGNNEEYLWGSDWDLGTGITIYDHLPKGVVDNILSGEVSDETVMSKDALVRYSPIFRDDGSLLWSIVDVRSVQNTLTPVEHLKTLIVYLIAIVLLSAVIVAVLLSRLIIKPIQRLEEGASRIEKGDWNYTVGTDAKDEIGELSRAFDRMVESVKGSREHLQERVDEQTAGLVKQTERLEEQRVAILNIMDDAEESRNASELESKKLSRILGTMPVGVVILSNATRSVEMVNRAILDIAGVEEKDIVGSPINSNLFHMVKEDGSEYPVSESPVALSLETKRKVEKHDMFIRRSNDSVVALSVTSRPITDSLGNISNVIVVFVDITKAYEIDKAKTEFVSLASHQLRTPLSAIGWYTDMLLAEDAGKLEEKQVTFLNEIKEGNQRMVELVNSLLNVSRLEMGTFIVEPEEMDIRDIVSESIRELKSLVDQKSIIVTEKFQDVPLIDLDPSLTKIAIDNIITNAVKYTGEGGTIDVDIYKDDKDMIVAVKDSGMGIPAEQQEQIFHKFFRADNVKKADTEGTGLGLYMVSSILAHTGGKIWFKSVEGKGTTFFISIPLSGMQKKEGSRKLA